MNTCDNQVANTFIDLDALALLSEAAFMAEMIDVAKVRLKRVASDTNRKLTLETMIEVYEERMFEILLQVEGMRRG